MNTAQNKLNRKYFIVLMFLAFAFSIAVRMIWVEQFSGVENFKWNNQLMINTNDGYFFAEGARDILKGSHEANDLSPVEYPIAKLTAFLASLLPISFESLILYMPTFFGSLLVIPIMLVARVFAQERVGFVAALLGGIAWSYYNRTMTGYYDTDLLVVVLPTFFIWGILYALIYEKNRLLLLAPIFAIASSSWHGGTINIVNGAFFMTLSYTFIYERKNIFYYKFLSVLVLALTTLSILLKLIAVFSLVGIFHFLKSKITDKQIIGIAIVSAIIYMIFGGAEWILGVLNNAYVTRALHADDLNLSLHYYGVVNTVREAGHIPFETFANRISGHTITFWLSLVGYLLFSYRYRLFILTLPMVALGFFALQGGLRFTVFAVPFMAIGVSYLIFLVADFVQNLFAESVKKYAKYGFVSLATVAVLYPNIMHIIGYRVPTVFNKDEVSVLSKLGEVASREDYVISWWDYGYPIRYYADVKTLIDGGKHDGNVNYTVAFELTNNQVAAANMARLDVEFTEKSFKDNCGPSFECMLQAYKIKNPNEFIKTLNNKNMQRPQKTRDIYFYLPNRMMNILPTVSMFSNLDLLSGKAGRRPFFYTSRNFHEVNNKINLGNNIILDKKTAAVTVGKQVVPLNYFVHTYYDTTGAYKVDMKQVHKNSSGISAIFMESHRQFLIVDDTILNSLYFRLLILEDYDKDLFEAVISSPYAKVYKLKI